MKFLTPLACALVLSGLATVAQAKITRTVE